MRLLDRARRPEYTGENRCRPCTAVNAVVVAVVAAALAFVHPVVALAAAAAGAAAIALRGYVVPYTPRFAPRLVAALPGGERAFDHAEDGTPRPADRTAGGLGDEDADGDRVLRALLDAGVLRGDDDLHLDPDFRAAWRDRMRDRDPADLAAACEDAAPAVGHAHAHDTDDGTWVVVSDADRSAASETWLSLPVATADVAAIRELTDRGVAPATAADAAAALRLFLDECPHCGGDVVETRSDGCCGGFGPGGPDRVLACAACDQRIATLD